MSAALPDIDRAALIGTGLIGASFMRALRRAGFGGPIIGADRDRARAEKAAEIGVVDDVAPSAAEAVAGADLIVIATPVGAIGSVLGEIAPAAPARVLAIDVGSVKGAVAAAGAGLADDFHFVPCHPVAGTEQSGPEAGFATLFENRWCIVTPLAREDAPYKASVARAAAIWRALGAQVELMDAARHDLALAVTSHLPHLIAFTLVGAADDLESVAQSELVKYSAGGFRDFTRIAASDPVMWRDVFLNNKEAVLEVLGRFTEELAILQRAIRWGDAASLEDAFARGRALRRAIVEAGQETAAPDFGRGRKG